MEHLRFEGSIVLSQLHGAGTLSALALMQAGYPSRVPFAQLYERYAPLMPQRLRNMDSRLFCKVSFNSSSILSQYAKDIK